jgi:hypothetical protein
MKCGLSLIVKASLFKYLAPGSGKFADAIRFSAILLDMESPLPQGARPVEVGKLRPSSVSAPTRGVVSAAV